jgi:hypothetical protein
MYSHCLSDKSENFILPIQEVIPMGSINSFERNSLINARLLGLYRKRETRKDSNKT